MTAADNDSEFINQPVDRVLGVILAGGFGRRLLPLTRNRSKPAVPFAGNYRIIDIPISNCIHSGVNQVFVLTQYNSASLNRHINQTYKFDIFGKGFIDVLASEETLEKKGKEFPHGTADAVRRSFKHFLAFRKFKYALILAGDQLYKMDFRALLSSHIKNKADATIGIIPTTADQSHQYGIVKVNNNHQITNFLEKPNDYGKIRDWNMSPEHCQQLFPNENQNSDRYFASMNMYLFNIDLLEEILFGSPSMMDFGKDVLPDIIPNKKVFGYIHSDFWRDIGTIKSFHSANIALSSMKGAINIYDQTNPFFAKPRFLPPSILRDSKINNVLVSDGTVISGSDISNSVIGIRSIIRKGTFIEDSVILGNDFYEHVDETPAGSLPLGIGRNCVIKNAIIDKNCRIGNDVKIINSKGLKSFDENLYTVQDGIIVIPKDTEIPPGTII